MDNDNPNRRQALEALRQASMSVDAAVILRLKTAIKPTGMPDEVFAARSQMITIAATVIEADVDRLMESAVASWQRYKADL